MPDIRMPDGTVIKNVPEGITQAQLLKKLKVNGYDTTKLLTPAGATSTSEAADVVPTSGVTPAAAPAATASVAAPMPEKSKRLAEIDAAISELGEQAGSARVKPHLGISGSADYQLRALKMQRDLLAKDIKEGPNTGFLGDLGSQFSAGVAGFDVGLGYLTGQDKLEQAGRQSQRIAQEELSPLGQEVSQKGVLGSDMTMGERAYAASLGVSRSVPDLLGGAVAAAAIGAAAPEVAAAALGARVLGLAAKSPRIAKLFGITAGAGGREAALTAGRTVIGTVAGSGIEGVQGGLYAGSDTKAAVLEQIEADPEAFANSDIGKKLLAVYKGDMEAAKSAAAEQIGRENALATGIATSLLSIPGSVFEARLLLGAASGKIGKELLIGTGAEALQEAPQSGAQQALSNLALQRAGSDVGTLEGVAKAAGEGAIVGGLMGGALGGVGAVTKKLAGSAEAETGTDLANSPQVEQEFYRLVTVETQALRDQNPDLTQRQAYNQVVKDAGKLYDTAILNTMLGAEGDIDVADADTGVDDFGGTVAGAATDIGTTPPPPGVTDVGETVGGGLERSVSSIPVSDVGEGAGVSPLDEAKQILADKKVKLTERVDVARQLLNDTILNNKLVNDVDQKQYDAAKNQLANGKHNGDPITALEAVTGKKFAAPLDISTTVAAPTIETAPSIDEVAVAPVKAAIKSVATTTPDASPIPSLAQASAQQLGITPTAAPEADVQATPDVAVQEDVQEDVQEAPVFNLADYTPQEVYDNLTRFGYSEAERRGYVFNTAENGMFGEGVREAKNPDIKPLTDEQVLSLERGSPEVLAAYKEGQQWGKEQVAATQAAPEVAVQEDVAPALVTEEIAPEVVAAPVEGIAPEADPYTGVLADIDTALADEAIDARTHKLLTSAVERRLPLEKIEAQLGAARTRSAEQAMGSANNVRATPSEALQSIIYRMQDAWRVLTGKPILANARLTDLLRDPDILSKMNPAQRGLAAALADVIDDDVDVYIGNLNFSPQEVFTLGVATVYDDAAPDVRLRGVSTAANIVTLLHEAVHVALIAKFGSDFGRLTDIGPDADPEMVALRNEVSKLIDAYNTMFEVESSADLLLKASPYGMKNLDEFIAEGLSQPSFQKFLEKGNLWTRFVELVRKLLKLQPKFQPQLDNVLKAGAKLIAASKNIDRMEYVSGTFEQRKKPKKPEVVSNGKVVVLTEAQKRTAIAKAKAQREKMNRIQRRIASTNDTADLLSDGIDLVKLARGDKENLALLRGAIDTVDVGRWQLILPVLSTEDIFRILKGRIPGLIESDRITRQDIPRFQSKEYGLLAEELEQISEFLKKYPKAAQALSDLEFATVAYQVDPTKASTPEEYADKFDNKTKEFRKELAEEKDAAKRDSLYKKINIRSKEIESVYVGVPGDERVLGWRDLGRPEFGGNKGKEIFKLIRDAHRRDLETKYNALRSRLMETKEDEDLDEALDKLEAQFKPAREQVIYFPAMRFGSYYARVGTGANSVFKMFETRTKRNQFVRLMKARGEEVTDTGNVEDLRNNFEQVSGGPLKEVLDLFGDNPKDIGALKSQVFDLWLQTMSAGDMRKHMAPRKMRAGYSTDILKNFANFRRSSINDIKRSKFGEQLRIEISRAKDMVKDMPDREKMEVFIREIELRTLNSLTPQALGNSTINKMIELGNKAAFYQYLANPKTAVIQLTQLHIVALPILAQKYGHVNATAALAKYGFSALGGFAASPLKVIPRPGNNWSFNWEQPNLLDNPVTGMKKESDPELYEVLSEGWNEGLDLNIFMDTFANEIGGFGNVDPQQSSAIQELMRGRVHTATWRGGVFVLDAMGSLMHQMERVNREATYMAALELAYRENKEKGQTHAEAKKNAIEAAADTTLAATFDFSSYNKPRILTSPVGRVAGQFYSFPYMMSSLLIRNMYTAIYAGKLEPGERVAAIEIATGTLLNMFAYAGIKGIPVYGLGVGIASMLLWLASQFDDDEEEGGLSYIDKDGNIKATYNVDWWLRNVWIPKFFGKDGTAQNLFGYDDDTAATVALSVEKGPISAITDVDVANSVALDFMFFVPEEPRAKTPEGAAGEFLVNFLGGATVSTGIDYYKAIDDLMNGYTNRALEKTPKVFSNVAKANRFAEEGQLNYDRELVGMPKEFWTSDKVALQMFGLASTEASQRQEQNYEGRKITQKVKAARDETLAKFRKLALDKNQFGFTPEVAKAHKEFMKEWGEYNRTFPTDVISIDTLYEVENNAINATLRSKATRGVPLDAKDKTPYMRDILKRRVEGEQ